VSSEDLYELLGVTRGTSGDEVRKAYRGLVREHHPDANPDDPGAEERFKKIQQVYEVLSNPQKRREYDQRSHTSSGRRSRAYPGRNSGRRSAGRPRAETSGGHEGQNTFSVDLSDLLDKLVYLSGDHAGRQKEGGRKLRGEDVARVARLLGVNLSRIPELLGENVKVRMDVSFGDGRPGRTSTVESPSNEEPPGNSSRGGAKGSPEGRS
jgi:molecular chaperone DnaJ